MEALAKHMDGYRGWQFQVMDVRMDRIQDRCRACNYEPSISFNEMVIDPS